MDPGFSMDEVDGELRAMAQGMEEAWKQLRRRQDDPGLTMTELAKLWGVGRSGAKRRIAVLRAAGMIIDGTRYVWHKQGYWRPTPVYFFRKEGENET